MVLGYASLIAETSADSGKESGEIVQGLAFSFENDASDVLVRMDPACLEGAIANLLDNAIKFTERGSVAVRVYEVDGAPQLEVRDTGVGMATEYLERCFEPFTQEDDGYTRRFEGLGVGLPLTKRYLEMNGASLAVRSEKGRGSIFRIRFPPIAAENLG